MTRKHKEKRLREEPDAPTLLYGITIFTSAFLLFQVQPIVAKYILPWYGGSQAVWSVSLLFFQAFLMLGYLYAHLLRKIGKRRLETVIHCALLAGSLLLLPIVPSEGWRAAAAADPTWQILGLLAATLGLPYMLLASTSPLVQSWYPKAFGMSTYRLYAVSNLGSLLGLVTYPFLIEPSLTRTAQAEVWSWGMGAFALLAGISAVASLRPVRGPAGPQPESRFVGRLEASGLISSPEDMRDPHRTIFWILLPALASVLLVSTTNKLVQELVAIPFLWILPLTAYLVTFILAFESPRWYDRRVFLALLAASFGGVLWLTVMTKDPPLLLPIGIYTAALFAGCMVCHGEMARLRPAPRLLTAFYLCIAAGGALGGLFVAIVAPAVFNDYTEFPLVLALIPAAWVAVRLSGTRAGKQTPMTIPQAGIALAVIAAFAVTLFTAGGESEGVIARERNFYGTLTIAEYGKEGSQWFHRTMRHGRVLHGLQYLHPKYESLGTTYYSAQSGAGIVLANYPRDTGRGLRIGVVGLGVGTLASWTLPGDTIRFYEINPAVEALARKYFTVLDRSRGRVETVTGDGRLMLDREPSQQFDLLVLDAFNNGSPPLHLLTKESFRIWFRHLRPDGTIAVNITGRYLNFVPVIAALADYFHYPWTTVIDFNREEAFNRTVSFWVILTRNARLQANEALNAATSIPNIPPNPPLWTDDFTSLFEIVQW